MLQKRGARLPLVALQKALSRRQHKCWHKTVCGQRGEASCDGSAGRKLMARLAVVLCWTAIFHTNLTCVTFCYPARKWIVDYSVNVKGGWGGAVMVLGAALKISTRLSCTLRCDV